MDSQAFNEINLYTGAGGGALASQQMLGWQTRCYVEIDKHCQRVLMRRIEEGYLQDAPIWDDARTFDGEPWRGRVDVISGGFPCQPFSVAGKSKAGGDSRNMWPDTIRIIREVRPRFVFLENVPGLLSRRHGYFGTILADLAEAGFDASWCVLSGGRVGADHLRRRLWILGVMADTTSPRLQGRGGKCELGKGIREVEASWPGRVRWWNEDPAWFEPRLDRMVDGLADRVDRIKAVGNGQIPIVAAAAWDLLVSTYFTGAQ